MERKSSKWMSLLLVLAMLVSMFGVNPKTAAAADGKNYSYNGYDVAFAVTSVYEGAFNGEITVTNTGTEVIRDWAMSFTFAHDFQNVWNATVLSHTGDSYVVKNYDWNADIKPGQSVSFGFVAKSEGTIIPPEAFAFVMKEEAVAPEKFAVEVLSYSDWGAGCDGAMIVKNLTGEKLENWELSFDYNREIVNISNAIIVSNDNGHYVIRNAEYNADIAGNASVHIGFQAGEGDAAESPKNFAMVQTVVDTKSAGNEGGATVTATPAPTAAVTPEPTATATPEPTATPEVTATPEPTVTPEVTATPEPTATPEATVTPEPTATPTPSEDISYDDVEILSYDKLLEMNEGDLFDVQYGNNGLIECIDGKCADFLVNNKNDAQKVVYGLKDVMAINDFDSLKFESESHSIYNDIYYFTQYYNGLEIVGSTVTVIVDADSHEAYMVNSYYQDEFFIDTNPNVSPEEAVETVQNLYSVEEISEPDLIIYDADTEQRDPKLVWRMFTNSNEIEYIYIDAKTGDEVYAEKVKTYTETGKKGSVTATYTSPDGFTAAPKFNDDIVADTRVVVLDGKEVNILVDEERQITVLDGRVEDKQKEKGLKRAPWVIDDIEKPSEEDVEAMYTLYNVIKAYDFFDELGWKSYDGKGSPYEIAPFYVEDEDISSGKYYDNASAITLENCGYSRYGIVRTTIKTWIVPDVIYHEYTHHVTKKKIKNEYRNESGAISEAYSDIFAELISDPRDWSINAVQRSLKEPTSKKPKCPSAYLDENYVSIYEGDDDDKVPEHRDSTVISHAAYLMSQGEDALTIDELIQLWYASYDYYYGNYTPKLIDCRKAVVRAARMIFNGDAAKIAKVNQAFDDVNVREYQVSIVVKDYDSNATIDNCTLTITSVDKERCNLSNATCKGYSCDPETDLCNARNFDSSHKEGTCYLCCHTTTTKKIYSVKGVYNTVLTEGIHRVGLQHSGYEIVDNKLEVGQGKTSFILYVKATENNNKGTISGALVDLKSNQPISGLTLEVFSGNLSGQEKPTTGCVQKMLSGAENNPGYFKTDELPEGKYTVFVSDNRNNTDVNTKYYDSSFVIDIEAGKNLVNRYVKVRQGIKSFIILTRSGRVWDAATNESLQGIEMEVYDYETDEMVAFCITDANGRYSFNVPVGIYKIHMVDSLGRYSDAWDWEFAGVVLTEEEKNQLPPLG